MLERIALKFGAHSGAEALSFKPGPITVFVGPNYSGKSKLIREVQWAIQHGRPDPQSVILDRISVRSLTPDQVDSAIDRVSVPPNPGENVGPGQIVIGRLSNRQQIGRENLRTALLNYHETSMNGNSYRSWAGQWYFNHMMRLLDGQSRIALTNDQPFGDLSQASTNVLQVIFRDDALRQKTRDIVYDAFGLFLIVDPTNAGTLRLRLSRRPPTDLDEEQGLTQRAASYQNEATLLSQASDGTRAFCGILIEVMAGRPDLLMLDEPEAFLHPSLSYKLGLEMARQVQGRKSTY